MNISIFKYVRNDGIYYLQTLQKNLPNLVFQGEENWTWKEEAKCMEG